MAIMTATVKTRPFTIIEFHKMAETGILTKNDRVELIQGEIIPMAPIGPFHAACVNTLTRMLIQRVPPDVIVHIQNPLRLDTHTEVYPDLALLRPRLDQYKNTIPEPADVLLLIEVADTTLYRDQHEKLPHYAQVGIPEVWLIDVTNKTVIVHREPSGQQYKHVSSSTHGTHLTSSSLSNFTIAVNEIFF